MLNPPGFHFKIAISTVNSLVRRINDSHFAKIRIFAEIYDKFTLISAPKTTDQSRCFARRGRR